MRCQARYPWSSLCVIAMAVLFLLVGADTTWSQESGSPQGNQLLSVALDEAAEQPTVVIRTREPVGYRYTVYDSFDPVRVVVDFPGMAVPETREPLVVTAGPIREVRASTFELTSGDLARVEILLDQASPYEVSPGEGEFKVVFPPADLPPVVVEKEMAETATRTPSQPDLEAALVESESSKQSRQTAEAVADSPAARPARIIRSVGVGDREVVLEGDGRLAEFRSFTLAKPPRMVLDVSGVKPQFKQREFELGAGFERMRVGTHADKIRFVFDAAGSLPESSVVEIPEGLAIRWNGGLTKPAAFPSPAPSPRPSPPSAPAIPVTVEGSDFRLEEGKSIFYVALSHAPEVIETVQEGSVVRFGLRNGLLSQAQRRIIDTSAFPSAVRLITPYTVREGNHQNVMYAVDLKGDADYHLEANPDSLVFTVANGRFSEPVPRGTETVAVPVPEPPRAALPAAPEAAAMAAVPSGEAPAGIVAADQRYTGEKITLVFDNADIRNILQLIGEVSDLNIIAGDEIQGNITLRLIDVPWDQALDLIMEIKGLGMLHEGNVVRILPKDKIRAMRQAELTAVKEERELEPVTTEVITVSYSDIESVAAPARDLLTERGKITTDPRNKQLIVTDIPVAIAQIRKLVAILDTPERQVQIEARIVEANSSFARDLGVKWGLGYEADGGSPWDPSNVNVGLGGSFLINPPAAGSVLSGAGLGTGFTFGRVGVDSTILDLRISALETSGHGKVISTPRVTTLNGQEASIAQGTKIPYQSSGADGLPKTEFVDANLELSVVPEINPDNSIILDITATNSSIGSTVSTGSGSAPAIDTKEAQTKVLVRDGETTVIGGVFVETESFSKSGVPWLMKVPLLGHLFMSDNVNTTRAELLIFITPRIVN